MKLNYLLIGALASLFMLPDSYAAVKYGSKKSTATPVASAPGGMYVSGGLLYLPSVTFAADYDDAELDAGYGIRLAAGKSFGNFRVEGELKYTDGAEYDESDRYYDGFGLVTETWEYVNSQLSIMANGYYDINIGDNFGLFVTAGIGLVRDTVSISYTYEDSSDYDEYDFDKSKWLFGYQIGGGMSYKLNANMNLDLMYRFGGTSEMKMANAAPGFNIYSHEISLGARYVF